MGKATNSIARKGSRGKFPLAESRGSASGRVWGNAPTVPRQTYSKEEVKQSRGSEASRAQTSRVLRRAPKLLSSTSMLCRADGRDRIAWQNKTPCVNSAEAAAHAGQEKNDRLHLMLFPKPSGNSVEFPQNKHIKKPCGLNPQGNFYRERRT